MNLYQTLQEQWQQTSLVEIYAVIFGVLSVCFSMYNKVWLYPAGLISTGIYTWMLSQSSIMLYAESVLNGYYFIMSAYGWWNWQLGNKEGASRVNLSLSSMRRKDINTVYLISGFGWLLFYVILECFTQSNVPSLDAYVSATACAGMWLLARRKVENWILLNLSNAMAIPLFFYKKLPLTGLLTIFLFIMAIRGYKNWKLLLVKQASN